MDISKGIVIGLKKALLAGIGIFLLSALVIAIDGFRDHINTSDVAIVFGSKVYPNGRVSSRLAARLDKAIELFQQGVFSNIIVSGATGEEGGDEAIAMKKHLLSHHIPETSILVDSAGITTIDTARNSALIMKMHGFKNALIVSQYFHITRARLALKQHGLTTIYHAHPDFFEWRDMYSLPREVIGYYFYLWRNFQKPLT